MRIVSIRVRNRIVDDHGTVTLPKRWAVRSTEAPPEAGLRAR